MVCETTGATNVSAIQKLKFDYRHNTLSFTVNALEYSAPSQTKVYYQMAGLDDKELVATSGATLRYPDLRQGTYTLVLYAANSDGLRNPVPKELMLVITPPFYKTWWFIVLICLAAAGIIGYIIYLRFSKTLELQRVRLKLYENLHDDVGSRLTAIVLSAEDLEQNENIKHPKLQAISSIARSIVGNMRRLVWAIDPENDRMNSIVQKINHDRSMILNDKIQFTIDVDPDIKNMIVPGEIRYQIISISSEALNNIAKYAEATAVKVSIKKKIIKYG